MTFWAIVDNYISPSRSKMSDSICSHMTKIMSFKGDQAKIDAYIWDKNRDFVLKQSGKDIGEYKAPKKIPDVPEKIKKRIENLEHQLKKLQLEHKKAVKELEQSIEYHKNVGSDKKSYDGMEWSNV